ncbi:MAG: epoxide hydrolase family protein [Micromonosporaceae bacterium]
MSATNEQIRPYRVELDQAELDDLADRVSRTRWSTGELTDAGWSRGVPTAYLKELAERWTSNFDWRAYETRLNAYPQFTTEIDGATVHFLHVESPEPDAMPLVLSHSWPGSVIDFLDVIGPLTDPLAHGGDPADAFHLVIPSIPGFAFSGPTRDGGWDSARIGRAFAALMARLGYHRYGAAGNDAGSMISIDVAKADPEHVVGAHVTQVFAFPSGDPTEFESFGPEEYRRLGKLQHFMDEHSGFNKIQSTRPQTIAHALTDSPTGQLAWTLDLVRGFGELPAEIEKSLDADFILANATLYWATNTAGSSARWYYDNAHAGQPGAEQGEQGEQGEDGVQPTAPAGPATPVGVAVFPGDFLSIRALAERDHHIVRWSEFERGGHYAAVEAPDLLTGDIRAFYRDLR